MKERMRLRGGLSAAAVLLVCLGLVAGAMTRHPAPAEPDAPVEIHMLISLGGDNGCKSFYEESIGRFHQEYQDVRLIPYYVESDTHAILKLLYSKQADINYDIACLGAQQITTLNEMDLIRPLDDYVIRDLGLAWLNELDPVWMADSAKAGNIYSLPFFYTSTVLYINEDGLQSGDAPVSTVRLLADAQRYYEEHGTAGLLLPADKLMLDILAADVGDEILPARERERTIRLTAPEKCELAAGLRRLLKEHAGMTYKANNGRNVEAFKTGAVPMMIGSSYYAEEIRESAGFAVKTVSLTINEETDYPLQGVHLYLVNRPEERDLAWASIQRLMALASDRAGTVPPADSLSSMAIRQNSKVQRMMEMAVLRMWREETETGEILTQLQAQVDGVLKEEE